jgi:hypothetical protein
VSDDIASRLQMLWSSASRLWLGLRRSSLLVNALGSERGDLPRVVLYSVWLLAPRISSMDLLF